MSTLVGTLYRFLASRQIVVLSFVAFLILSSLFQLMNREFRPKEGPSVIALQLSFSKARFIQIIEHWGNQPDRSVRKVLPAFRRTVLYLDYIFPVVYAVLFSSAIAFLTTELDKDRSLVHVILFVSPFIAAVLDWIENCTEPLRLDTFLAIFSSNRGPWLAPFATAPRIRPE